MKPTQHISSQLVLVPAYGRTYKTSQEVHEHWKAGKDFRVINGPYCSIRDLDYMDVSSVWVDLGTTIVRVE